jgi:hypothetical protein
MSGTYDPKIIERFADQLLRKADSVRVGAAVCGGVFGVVVGSVPLTPLESIWPIPGRFGVATMLLGTLLGILIGFVVGEGRAFRYRVEAQRALFQVDIERRVTAAVTTAVSKAATEAVQAATAAAPPAGPAPGSWGSQQQSVTAPPAPLPVSNSGSSEAPALRPPGTSSPAPPEAPPLSPVASA